ncbi:MAG: hypothetical protein A2V90_01435 [Gammaproteobacteria bacterium RBG_16_57_12]|nr:MAG: hypothetical protein A2V90_01435 [Gammaproteobacteria bacterium RBG_16_57_12]
MMLMLPVTLLSACNGMFFYPMQTLVRTPAQLGLAYEEINFPSLDGTQLNGWLLRAKGEAKATVVFFHGNAENISTHIGAVYWLPAAGYNVFLFDYRGYGLSQGKAELHGVHLDARAALQYIRERPDIDPSRLIVFGQSLGGAIALYTAATEDIPLRAVVVESAFARYRGIFREKLGGFFLTWPLQWPLSLGVSDQYSPQAVVGQLKAPLLIIHGDADPIIPIRHAYDLYEQAGKDKELWVVEGGGHTAAFGPFREVYRPKLLEYLRQRLQDTP